MLTVTFVIQNPKTYNLFSGWGMIILLFLLGNYLMIRSFRRVWADLLIKRHVKTVDNFILKAIDEKDPWLINLLFTIDPTGNVPLYKIFYNCIWDYERIIKDYSVWRLDQMVTNKELFYRVYKKDSSDEIKNKKNCV